MIRQEIVDFLKYRYFKNPSKYILYQIPRDRDEILVAKPCILKISSINNNFTIDNKATIIFEDCDGELLESSCIPDNDYKIGDRCLVMLSYKEYGSLGYLPITPTGYLKLNPEGKLSKLKNIDINSDFYNTSLSTNKILEEITERFFVRELEGSIE